MLRRISLWALVGAVVAFLWSLYFTWLTWGAYHGGPPFEFGAVAQTLANITIPIGPLFGRHHAITWYWSMVMNAAMYAFLGLAVETVRLTIRSSFARLRH
jgi:hypothetical protein